MTKPLWKSVPRNVEQPGTILAYEETKLFARVPGYILLPRDDQGRILYDIGTTIHGPIFDAKGQEIKAGDVLAEVVVPEMVEDVKQKKSLTRQAEAEVEQAKKALAAAEANIAIMDANVLEAKALYKRWDSESKRTSPSLAKDGGIDVQARDETQNQFAAAAGPGHLG